MFSSILNAFTKSKHSGPYVAARSELESEETLVSASRELIERFEKKIQDAIARVWGEEHIV